MTKDLLDLLRELEARKEEINSLFAADDYLDAEISMVWEMIEDAYGIKGDDDSIDILADFGIGDITKAQAIKKLKALK